MCCIMPRVIDVSKTCLFARPAENGRQVLVYSMQIKADDEVAMILPIPVPGNTTEDAVKFINLKDYQDFFKDMGKGFPPRKKGFGGGGGGFGGPPEDQLKVVEVGDFEASFVPTVNDFDRLDKRFHLPQSTWRAIPAYKKYGFVVFKLKPDVKPDEKPKDSEAGEEVPKLVYEGEHPFHPMAFEFPSAIPGGLYFPTVHIHDGEIHKKETFDHSLYCQLRRGNFKRLQHFRESPQLASEFMNIKKCEDVIVPNAHVYFARVEGKHPNQDIWI